MKSLLITGLLAGSLLFTACGSENEAGEPAVEETGQEQQVEAAPAKPVMAGMMDGIQVITVAVYDTGYSPASIGLKAGVPAKIIFDQHGTTPCAWDVKSPDLGIGLTKLPKMERTTIEFTPEKGGTYAFTCGMDMLRGSVIVRES